MNEWMNEEMNEWMAFSASKYFYYARYNSHRRKIY